MIFEHFFEICLREQLSEKLQDKAYAQKMYAALCNQEWAYAPRAPKNYTEFLTKLRASQSAITNRWWRKISRNVLDFIRTYITLPIGRVRKINKSPEGYRTISIKDVPVLSLFDRIVMKARFSSILCPQHKTPDWVYSCSWRYAGGLMADLRNIMGCGLEDYMDFYCTGSFGGVPEGFISPEIEEDLNKIGWHSIGEEAS